MTTKPSTERVGVVSCPICNEGRIVGTGGRGTCDHCDSEFVLATLRSRALRERRAEAGMKRRDMYLTDHEYAAVMKLLQRMRKEK